MLQKNLRKDYLRPETVVVMPVEPCGWLASSNPGGSSGGAGETGNDDGEFDDDGIGAKEFNFDAERFQPET